MDNIGDKNKELANLYLKLYSDCNKFMYTKRTKNINKEIDCNQYYDKYINYSIKHYVDKSNINSNI